MSACKRQALHMSGVEKVLNTVEISKLQQSSDMIQERFWSNNLIRKEYKYVFISKYLYLFLS